MFGLPLPLIVKSITVESYQVLHPLENLLQLLLASLNHN